MATGAKASSSSCFSFLKDAFLLPTRNAKLFVPALVLVAVPTLLINIANVLYIQPLLADILLHINKIKNIDPSTPEYAKLMEEIAREVRELVVISIALSIAAVMLSFPKQIIAFFTASTTYSGDRYSLRELISKVIMKRHRFKGPIITIAMVSTLELASMILLAALLQLVMRHSGQFSMVALIILPFLAFLYLNVVFMVTVAVSVADTERRGMSALRQAWRLMTQVQRKEGCVLVVVTELLSMAPSLLYVLAVGYIKKSMAMGLALLTVYGLVSGAVQLFYFSAAMVYYYQAMESKEEVMAHDYFKIPTGEANVRNAFVEISLPECVNKRAKSCPLQKLLSFRRGSGVGGGHSHGGG